MSIYLKIAVIQSGLDFYRWKMRSLTQISIQEFVGMRNSPLHLFFYHL
ncbi:MULTISPECIES: hypothetical protein [Calothrix]|uniref:Uncharacterized protein n=1 Tax=Calothrix parietina FACHB-288 TaxID=2692896 RepID=A0ABR8AAV9_9CYAN|nr:MULTISPECIES: hypothetical protein [Calothrix]MBD2196994.1 hypothetical protein [Calothrix parietina FACHB-288]